MHTAAAIAMQPIMMRLVIPALFSFHSVRLFSSMVVDKPLSPSLSCIFVMLFKSETFTQYDDAFGVSP